MFRVNSVNKVTRNPTALRAQGAMRVPVATAQVATFSARIGDQTFEPRANVQSSTASATCTAQAQRASASSSTVISWVSQLCGSLCALLIVDRRRHSLWLRWILSPWSVLPRISR
jgi:hypothetical protein